MESVLTLADVANLLQVSQRTVYRLAQEGRIPAFKVGQAWRFRNGDIQAWIDAQVRGADAVPEHQGAATERRRKGDPTR